MMTNKFTDVNSESEAGVVGYIDEEGIFISVKAYNKVINVFKCLYTPVFLAPPSAQAIETAVIMKCVEVCSRKKINNPVAYGDAEYNKAIQHCLDSVLALIPQDGRTQLAETCLSVAVEVKEACDGPPPSDEKLRAIVTNLIGEKK